MRLSQLVAEYVTFKQSLGMRFRTESDILNAFCRATGDIDATEVSSCSVKDYLAGTGPITAFWHRKFEALTGFYRYAQSCELVISACRSFFTAARSRLLNSSA
jgi:hypothetical protein